MGENEEYTSEIPGEFTARGGTLEVDFVPTDLTGGADCAHPYNDGPIADQGWMIGQETATAPFSHPFE